MTLKELKHIAPTLASIKNKGTGFTLPPDYFNKVESEVSSALFLDKLPDETGYDVPDNYFEKLEKNVMTKIQPEKESYDDIPEGYFDTIEDAVFARLEKEKVTKVISLKKYWIPALVAASLLLFIGIYNPFSQNDSLEIAEIEQWIEEGNLDLSAYEIAEVLNSDLENMDFENSIGNEDLENYLSDEISEESFYN